MEITTSVTVMMETILFHTDAPDLVLARDEFGTAYLCLLFLLDGKGHHYVAIKITSARLADLRDGKIDLRTAITLPERRTYYRGIIPPGERSAIQLEPTDHVPDKWLPKEGFFLSSLEKHNDVADDAVIIQQSLQKNAAVIVCRVNPKEARGLDAKVDADRLAGAIKKFQFLVRHSAKSALVASRRSTKKISESVGELHVVGFSPGSFNVHFESKDHADLFGESVIGLGMQKIDAMMQVADSPIDQIAEKLDAYRGSMLAAYYDLLKFIDRNDLPFAYQWTEPALDRSRFQRISVESARAIAAIIETEKTLTTEPQIFTARFTSVNTEKEPFAWTARDADELKFSGHVHENFSTVLNDVRIRTQRYIFDCDKRLVATPSSDPVWRLFLKELKAE
jgi:hypothetical protein